jgi:hypothetical protein
LSVSLLAVAAVSGSAAVHAAPSRLQPAAVFASIGERWHKHCQAMLAWSVVLAIALVLASLLQAVAATAFVAPEQTALPAAHLYDSLDFPGGLYWPPAPYGSQCTP